MAAHEAGRGPLACTPSELCSSWERELKGVGASKQVPEIPCREAKKTLSGRDCCPTHAARDFCDAVDALAQASGPASARAGGLAGGAVRPGELSEALNVWGAPSADADLDALGVDATAPNSRPQSEAGSASPADRARHGKLARKLQGEGITTVMVRNVPAHISQAQFLRELKRTGFHGAYDFAHVPRCFETNKNRGYAFINFTDSSAVAAFVDAWHNKRFFGNGQLTVSAASVQGLESNIRKWNTRVQRIRNPELRPYIARRGPPPLDGRDRGGAFQDTRLAGGAFQDTGLAGGSLGGAAGRPAAEQRGAASATWPPRAPLLGMGGGTSPGSPPPPPPPGLDTAAPGGLAEPWVLAGNPPPQVLAMVCLAAFSAAWQQRLDAVPYEVD